MVRIVRRNKDGELYVLDNRGERMYLDCSLGGPFPSPGTRVQLVSLLHGRFVSSVWAEAGDFTQSEGRSGFAGHFYSRPTLQSIVRQLDREVA